MSQLPPSTELFALLGSHSHKVRCTVCGTVGYPGGRWQIPHIRGHAVCPVCGRANTVRKDGSPRVCNRRHYQGGTG